MARTETLERTFVHLQVGDNGALREVADESEAESRGESTSVADERAWWEPLTRIAFDDPEQESPSYRVRNHVRVPLPYPGIWLTAFRSMTQGVCGVFLTGKKSELPQVLDRLNEEREQILSELPGGIHERLQSDPDRLGFAIYARLGDFATEDECREWLAQQLNHFVNVFLPRLKAMWPGKSDRL